MVEYQSANAAEIPELKELGTALAGSFRLPTEATFTSDPTLRAELWHLRKGLYMAVAGARPLGSAALLEDVVVPVLC